MKHKYRNIRDCIFNNPLCLDPKNKLVILLCNHYLPADTGIEIECDHEDANILISKSARANFVNTHHSHNEKRFHIHSGVQGFKDLYNMCEILKESCVLNLDSGIHYHVDLGAKITPPRGIKAEWVLKELDGWKYKGNYNIRAFTYIKSGWISYRDFFNTLEFRIGEMTFDYEVIVKRIIHAQSITKRLKKQFAKK